MMKRADLYDVKCEELAQHFLETDKTDGEVKELAISIQQAVEDWFFMRGHGDGPQGARGT